MSCLRWLQGRVGPLLLIAAFAVALGRVLTLEGGVRDPGKIVLRIAHFQMETGVREAVDLVAREYEKLHPGVEIQQIVIGERGYGSWVTTRLVGGTAPDLVAMGGMDRSLIVPLLQRYFLPLSSEIAKPNPYNRGTPLEGVPWKNTFYDDMESGASGAGSSGGCFIPELMDYYRIPSSAFTLRLFYNKELLREATGLEAPPAGFQEFIAACEQIKDYGARRARHLYPIAGTAARFNTRILWSRFEQAVNSTFLPVSDANRDSDLNSEESIIALVGGAVDFRDPRVEAMFKGRACYNRQFQPGFYAADRMDAAFLFLQGRAVMIPSGSWDAGSYAQQAGFEIGVCDFPLPAAGDPEFGRFVEGPAAEELQGAFSFSVNRTRPHTDVALDFMRFLTSRKMNALLNERAQWIPMVRGNRPIPFVAPFWPHLDGVKEGIKLDVGGLNGMRYEGLVNLHAAGRLTFEQFIDAYTATFVANADEWMQVDRPRDNQLAANQDEFAKNAERVLGRLTGRNEERALLVLDGQLARRNDTIEYTQRYEAARARSPLPKP